MAANGDNVSPRIRAAAYARISTLIHGQSLDNQVMPIKAFAETRGFDLLEVYTDEGLSGAAARERRPGLDRLCRDIRQGRYKGGVVIIAALDRLFRDTRHMLNICEEWASLGVRLISLRENLDFATPVGQMTLTVLAAASALERSIIAERIRVALQVKKIASRESGGSWRCGRPVKLTPQVQERIINLRAEGFSIRQISKQLQVAKSSVQRVLAESQKPTSENEGGSHGS